MVSVQRHCFVTGMIAASLILFLVHTMRLSSQQHTATTLQNERANERSIVYEKDLEIKSLSQQSYLATTRKLSHIFRPTTPRSKSNHLKSDNNLKTDDDSQMQYKLEVDNELKNDTWKMSGELNNVLLKGNYSKDKSEGSALLKEKLVRKTAISASEGK